MIEAHEPLGKALLRSLLGMVGRLGGTVGGRAVRLALGRWLFVRRPLLPRERGNPVLPAPDTAATDRLTPLRRSHRMRPLAQASDQVSPRRVDPRVDVDALLYIPTRDIVFAALEEFYQANRGEVRRGHWDVLSKRFDQLDIYIAFDAVMHRGLRWQDTAFFQNVLNRILAGDPRWGCRSRADLERRCCGLKELYRKIARDGYLNQQQVRERYGRMASANARDEIIVGIGRHGDILFGHSAHRLSIAKHLRLPEVPVRIAVRHEEWVAFQGELAAHAAESERGKLCQPVGHPDLRHLPAEEASLAVLLSRPHEANLETVNDKDTHLSNFWRAVQNDPEEVAFFADWPVNEADLHARHRWLVEQTDFREKMIADPEFHDPKIAGWWVWGIAQWIGGGWCSRPEWKGRAGHNGHQRGVHVKKPRIDRNNGGFVHAKRPMLDHKGRGVQAEGRRPQLSHAGQGVHGKQKRPALDQRSLPGVHRQRPELYGNKGIHTQREWLTEWMADLSARLRRTRVCCGDWSRVLTPSVTWKVGGSMLTGVLLDPPYSVQATGRHADIYNEDHAELSNQVREWAIENGRNSLLRIALCGFEGEHEMPEDWECISLEGEGRLRQSE